MNNESLIQAHHLDDIRNHKKITVEELCDGICNDRTYRRYISGSSILPFSKLKEFCNKLDISISDFFYSLSQKDRKVYSLLANLYDLLITKKNQKAKKEFQSFKYKNQLDSQNLRFYNYIGIRLNYNNEDTNEQSTLQLLKKQCNYDAFHNRTAFDFVDILILHLISQIENKSKVTTAMEVLQNILVSDESIYISSENKYILPPIYANVSIMLGRLGRIQESLKLSKLGIEFCKYYKISDSLSNLYYTEMLGHQAQGQQEKTYISAVKCISNCISSDNTVNLNQYIKLIQDDLGVNPFQLFNLVEDSLKSDNQD